MRARVLGRFSCARLFVSPWIVAHQAPLSMEFFRQEYWSGLPCPPPGDILHSGIEPTPPATPALKTDSLTLSHQGSPLSLTQFLLNDFVFTRGEVVTCTKKIESLEWSDDHFILRIHGDGGYRAERRERDHHSLVSLLNLTASLWAPNLCQAWCWVLGLNFDNPHGYQGKKCTQQKKYWFLYNIKDWFSLSPRVLANSKDSTLGAPHLPSFLRHKWPILRAVELCLKNVKCIWKLHIFADARSPELRYFHGQPLGRPLVGASQMTSWSTLSRPPRGISCLKS